ncbi:MAG TPA: STT3 domain-containing protein [Anaeromyxobacteraceae bacterium]|nr:STT3 domain-containing protein [Anaeromyxobacteraceae bacterium]
MALAIGVRLLPWSQVFTPLGVRFGPDGDAYYHALRARVLAQEHRVLWRDPGLSFPVGADVPWPPLFDLLVAAPAWLLGGAVPSNATVERVAAVLPVVLAALGVLVAILLGREVLGRRGAVVAGLLLAVAPVHVAYTGVGRPDHHVLEVLLLTALLALYAAALRRPSRSRWWWALLFAALLTASFWSWVGSTLYVVLLGALVFAAHVFAGRDAGVSAVRVVGRAAVIAGLLTGATVALFGPPGALATVSLGGLSALPVLASGALAAWCGALFVASRRRPGAGPGRRATEGLLASVAVAAVALMAVPPLRAAVGHGLRAAGHSGEWGFILETRSLLGGTRGLGEAASAVFTNFGMLPLLAVAGIAELARWWRDPERRPVAVFVATLGLVFVALAAHMSRFGYYAAVPLSIYGAMGLAAIARGGSRSGGRAGAASALVAALVGMASTLPGIRAATVPSARLEGVVRAVAPLASGMLPADGALLVRWDAGHHARYFSGRPVVASPFGADIGREAMADAAAFFLAEDPAAALGILARRGVRWVVVDDPASAALEAFAFAGGSSPPVTRAHDPVRGDYIHCEPSFDRLVAARLFYEAGSATPTNPSPLGGYRLVAEVGTRGRPITRLFEVVKGAEVRVRGARPSGTVAATVTVATPIEQFTWQAAALADAAGEAVLRLPLVTGSNGATVAGSYLATDGSKRAVFPVTEAQVRGGEVLTVDLTN